VSDNPVTAGPGETPSGTADAATAIDLTAAPQAAVADVPPELLAQSLGEYLRAWWLRVRGGDSGVLPVILAIVVVAVSFQVANSKFLSSQNLVNLFEQSTVYMVLAMAEIFALLLGEIDLSVGLVMGLGSVVVAELVQPTGANFPWWLAIIVELLACSAFGAIQGWLVARLKMPSFIVTLGGLLILEGVAIIVLGGSLAGIGNSRFTNEVVLYDIFYGEFSPLVGWILLAVLVGAYGAGLLLRDARKRRDGLETPPRSLTVLKVVLVAAAGIAVVAICNVNRAHFGTIEGVPYIIAIVLRLDGPAAANPLRPLRVRHRRQPGGGPTSRGQPAQGPHLGLRPRGPDLRDRRGAVRLVAGLADHQHHQDRQQLRPAGGGRGGHRRYQPLRRPGQDHPRRTRRPRHRCHLQRPVPAWGVEPVD
jgi:Branched-chain amino acid transport system / permease component